MDEHKIDEATPAAPATEAPASETPAPEATPVAEPVVEAPQA